MYKVNKPARTTLTGIKSYVGESIEKKVNRIVNNKEPIKDGAPLIYSERKDGVNPAYDIRTDRFEVAVEKMDYVTKSHIAKRSGKGNIGDEAKKNMDKEAKSETKKDSGTESTETTK